MPAVAQDRVILSKAAYARHASLSKGRVTQLTKPGELLAPALTADNKIDVEEADRIRDERLDGANVNAKLPLAVAPRERDEVPAETELKSASQEGLTDAKLRKANADARRAELELAKETEHLVDKQALMQVLSEKLQMSFEAIRHGGQSLSERLVHDGLIEGEQQDAVQRALNDELGKVVDGLRQDWGNESA